MSRSQILLGIFALLLKFILIVNATKYKPTWKSLDKRPLPGWFDQAKFGIFLHWGVYSVPTFGDEWFQFYLHQKQPGYPEYMAKNFKPGFTYQEFAKDFTAENYNATEWVQLFEASGAKYVILTSKHHDGYALWPNKYSYSWNSVDVGPHRDLVGELAEAVGKSSILTFGLYHSLLEWFHPLYVQDKGNKWKTQDFAQQKAIPELKELVMQYQPQYIWSDGHWEASSDYWHSKEFLAWLFNDSPVKDTVVVNSRWGTEKNHGSVDTPEDGYNPGKLQPKKWENAIKACRGSWAYQPAASLKFYLTINELLEQLMSTVSFGGNLLLDIGPSKDGRITPMFEQQLREMGKWLKVNGKAIYESSPWIHQNETLSTNVIVWYTKQSNPERVYVVTTMYPESNKLELAKIKEFVTDKSTVSLLGYEGKINMTISANHVTVEFPSPYYAYKISKHAWTFEFVK